ncbi:endonuclease III [Alkanindiges hydrocarboniclasticus]|jgi:endonuclease-3|uniref:Endonuclease III n=1 Tax=Alkanindiges hydrocarboniclasticus TaxID=1907941 RepID=A0A1S8CUM2_9GAMM|nr:endonuclease III [Alkanindiges hydrocarboniclasticus]ONG39573.1 endonuclease III [Alkanindiges hydrocarboniclasticus]
MNPEHVEEFFERLQAQRPDPTTELVYHSPFELLIAVILSAQMTDVGVNKATAKLFAVANRPESILALGVDGLKEYIRTVNFYTAKANNIIKTCQMLIDLHGGQVPDNRKDLEALAGVGRKTANVVLNTAFGHPTMAVDTHIFRVSNRTGLAPAKTVEGVEKKLLDVVPASYLTNAHHWILLHGRYTCKARVPLCAKCIVADLCQWPEKYEFGAAEAIAHIKTT